MGDPIETTVKRRIALLWRGDPAAEVPAPERTRLRLIFSELAALGVDAEPVIWAEEVEDALRERLLAIDGVLVWVNPLSEGQDRSRLDPLLREVAGRGVWVSAHPDVILKMGVKEVLHRTRDLSWGADTHLYRTLGEFRSEFPERLAASGPRVLKQNRGNGGEGVWKVELIAPGRVRVLHAPRGSVLEDIPLDAFIARCEAYFEGDGLIIDQPFQPRLPEGMIRCYLASNEVVGFGHQLIKALIPPPPSGEPDLPGPRIMHGSDAPQFQALRAKVEREWVPAMQRIL
ncbi:MAG TPA: Cj0069 family protein, partial [Myxococcaceae bacterium]|nr:Cj0069 family protein [Myxococcaceae bacterium]